VRRCAHQFRHIGNVIRDDAAEEVAVSGAVI